MGRPQLKPGDNTKIIVFRLPETLRIELGFYLAHDKLKIAELMRELIKEWIEKQRRMF